MPVRSGVPTDPPRSEGFPERGAADGGTTAPDPGVIWLEGTARALGQEMRKPNVRRLRSPKGRQMKEVAAGARAFQPEAALLTPADVVSGRWSWSHSRPELFEVSVEERPGERSGWASVGSCRNPVFHKEAWKRRRPRLRSGRDRASEGFRDEGREGNGRTVLWGAAAGERHETRATSEGNWETERPKDDSSCPEMEWNDWLLHFL